MLWCCAQSCPTLCDPMGCSSIGLLCRWDFPGKNTGVGGRFPLQRDLPDPGIEPASPAIWQVGSLPLSHLGSPVFPDVHISHIFIHSSLDGHLGYFHILAITNKAMNTGMHVSLLTSVSVFFRYTSSSGIAGSYSSSTFSLGGTLHS